MPAIWSNDKTDSKNFGTLIDQCKEAVKEVFKEKSEDTRISIFPEPSAAALYCAYKNHLEYEDLKEYKLLVVDYGGGTLDITYCDVKNIDGEPIVHIMGSPWGTGMNTTHDGLTPENGSRLK